MRIDLVNPWQRAQAARLLRRARSYCTTTTRARIEASRLAYDEARSVSDEFCEKRALRFVAEMIGDTVGRA